MRRPTLLNAERGNLRTAVGGAGWRERRVGLAADTDHGPACADGRSLQWLDEAAAPADGRVPGDVLVLRATLGTDAKGEDGLRHGILVFWGNDP